MHVCLDGVLDSDGKANEIGCILLHDIALMPVGTNLVMDTAIPDTVLCGPT